MPAVVQELENLDLHGAEDAPQHVRDQRRRAEADGDRQQVDERQDQRQPPDSVDRAGVDGSVAMRRDPLEKPGRLVCLAMHLPRRVGRRNLKRLRNGHT